MGPYQVAFVVHGAAVSYQINLLPFTIDFHVCGILYYWCFTICWYHTHHNHLSAPAVPWTMKPTWWGIPMLLEFFFNMLLSFTPGASNRSDSAMDHEGHPWGNSVLLCHIGCRREAVSGNSQYTYIPTYLLHWLPICLPTYLPTYLLTYILTSLHTYLCTYVPTYLCTYLPTYLPT